MTKPRLDETLLDRSRGWLADLEKAITDRDKSLLEQLFLQESYWRDLVAFTWDTRQFWGRETVQDELFARAGDMNPSDFVFDPDRSAPRLIEGPQRRVEVWFAFKTKHGGGSAFTTLIPDADAKWGMRAKLLSTTLTRLDCNPPPEVTRRGYEPSQPGESWIEYRSRVRDLTDRDPDVLIVGGGQSGLSIAAHLDRLGVSYVVVEKHANPGDSWRKRYAALALHTPTCANNLPFTTLPPTFPKFMSKDQWANWVDAYATTMDINVWTSTEFVSGSFDEAEFAWDVVVRRDGEAPRSMRVKHVVMALGFTGVEPVVPDLPGLNDYAGDIVHTSTFGAAEDYRGKRVLVVGTATSGHDVALDLYHHGAAVTMGQRGPACIVPVLEAERYNAEYLEPGISCEEIDQRRNSNFVYPMIVEKLRGEVERTEAEYADLFDGLRRAGMTLTVGEDRTGWLMKLHRTFSGYYLDVGACQVIIDGGIKVLQLSDVQRFTADGAVLNDGSEVPLDAIVLATGYKNMQAVVAKLLGAEIADRVGLIGGIGADGEPRNMCRPTRQPHLWMVYGGIMDARKTSGVLALQIVANLHDVVPTLVRTADGDLAAVTSDVDARHAADNALEVV